MVVSESRDVGMDRALERARTLHTSVGVALHDYRLDPQEMAALREIRTHIAMLENKVREIKVAQDDDSKAALLAELDPIRQEVIEQCHRNKPSVLACQAIVQEILDWCELKNSAAAGKPATYRSSVDDVQRSTEALIGYSGLGTATDVSSSWVQSQAQRPQSKSSAFDTAGASLSLSNWESSKTKLRPVKTVLSNSTAAIGNGSAKGSPSILAQSLTAHRNQQQQNGLRDHVKSDQTLASPAAVAAGTGTPKIHQATEAARAHAAKVVAQRRSMEQSAAEQQQQEQEQLSWKGQLSQAQQLARQLRPARPFLHLDGRSDASLTSSGGSSQLHAHYPGDMGVTRYSNRDDDATEAESAAGNGWDTVEHLRHQPVNDRSSLRTSLDIQRALKSGNVVEAAILSSNASRVHILHDAVPHKPRAKGKLVDVPVVPPCLAVSKKKRWWVKVLQGLATTAGLAVAVGAAALAATGGFEGVKTLDDVKSRIQKLKKIQVSKPSIEQQKPTVSAAADSKQQQRQHTAMEPTPAAAVTSAPDDGQVQQHRKQKAVGMPRLPYAPVGPAPDASAGCG